MADGFSVVTGGYYPESLLRFVECFPDTVYKDWGLFQCDSVWVLCVGTANSDTVYANCDVYSFSGTSDNYRLLDLGSVDLYTFDNSGQYLYYCSANSNLSRKGVKYEEATLYGLCVCVVALLIFRILRHVS